MRICRFFVVWVQKCSKRAIETQKTAEFGGRKRLCNQLKDSGLCGLQKL